MSRSVGAVDRRLLRRARGGRALIAASVGLGCAQALLVVAQAWLIAYVAAESLVHARAVSQLEPALAALLLVVIARAGAAWATQTVAVRTGAQVKSRMRRALLARAA